MIVRPALDLIVVTRPDWFTLSGTASGVMRGTANVPVASGSSDFILGLRIAGEGRRVSVCEDGTSILPTFCPDRHINEDSSFCLGYGAGDDIQTSDDAAVWWKLLRQYLLLQRTAGRTGRWPAGHSIAHEDAGAYHVAAREAAARLGILEAYDAAVAGDTHWTTDGRVKVTKDGNRLLNGRLPCPVGCTGRRGKPKLRRKCCHRYDVAAAVYNEAQRQQAERRFWARLKSKGVRCCNTLSECPLRLSADQEGANNRAPDRSPEAIGAGGGLSLQA